MLKLLWLLLIVQSALAQDLSRDLDYIETRNTQALAFNVPLFMDLDGNINIISRNKNADMSFRPMAHVAWRRNSSLYIKPVQSSEFGFNDQKSDLSWIQVKRKRWEAGLGLGAVMGSAFSVGLAPYRGARQVVIRHVETPDEETPAPKLPETLETMRDWRIGDQGTYQTYGGVEIRAGINYSVINIVSVGLTIQNLFSVVVNKISPHKIVLSISEENLNKRRIQSGVALANAKIHFFNGKRLTTHFSLDLDDPSHHKLYQQALKGKLNVLQSELPDEAQKMEWKGSERVGYIGIPGVAGKYFSRSELEMNYEEQTEVIDIRSRKNSGIFVPLRNHNKIVYQTESAIILFWFSEMNKAEARLLDAKFLIPGRIMGAKGFASTLPAGTKIGSTLSQMGISFTREELENITPAMLEEVLGHFQKRCESMNLDCARPKRLKKISKTLRGYLSKNWEEVRDKLGFLMIEEPALIYSYIKTIKSKKKLYFKFLNQRYQSLEGAAPIEL